MKSCTIFKETDQRANFTVFTMCGRELPAERAPDGAKLVKRKRIFLHLKGDEKYIVKTVKLAV